VESVIAGHAALKITPQPPLLKTNLCPVDKPRGSPRAWLSNAKWRPADGINGAVCRGATRATSEQSYGVEPKIDRSPLSGDLGRKVVGEDVRLLVCNAAGF
jgi:hypothetical protein